MKRIVLAVSGQAAPTGIARLREDHGADVIAATLDVGQGGELEAVRDRALAAGAVRAHVLDVRDELARSFVLPALQADARDADGTPLAVPLTRPLIALKLVEIAAIEQADAVAHGGDARQGMDGATVGVLLRALNPPLDVIDLAQAPASAGPRVGGSVWGRTVEHRGTDGAHPSAALPTLPAPGQPLSIEVTFARGVPAAVNGVDMPLIELVASLGLLAGHHGVGRFVRSHDGVTRVVDAPAAAILHAAHAALQHRVSDPDARRFAERVRDEYTSVVCAGRWFTPLRSALDAFVGQLQDRVTGSVRLRLVDGQCEITDVRTE